MKRKNNYIRLGLLIVLYFLIEFLINFVIIKLLGGYDNKINYDLSVTYSRLIVSAIFFIAIIIFNKKAINYIGFKHIVLKKILLYSFISIVYAFVIIFIKNHNILEYNFHWSQKYTYFLVSAIFVAPLYEEILKKAIPIEFLLKKDISPIFITVFISILFSIYHLPSLEQMLYALILGILTSIIYIKERNIIYPIIFHFVYNFIVLCIY